MSNRTALANKAVELKWKEEQHLISEGKGTRNWTEKEQNDILKRGKAYDDEGKAFEGHHMKSVEKFPDFQGEPNNIQFLSKKEHLAAHNGSFRNPANGYFDPYTGKTKDFGLDEYEPCEIHELTQPIVHISNNVSDNIESTKIAAKSNENNVRHGSDDTGQISRSQNSISMDGAEPDINKMQKIIPDIKRISGGKAGHLVGKTVEFYTLHKKVIDPIARTVGQFVIAAATDKVMGRISRESNKGGSPSIDISSDTGKIVTTPEDTIKRASPRRHMVSAGGEHYNGVWKEKAAYPRGGKKSE